MQSEFIEKKKEVEGIYSFFFTKPPQLVYDAGDFTELSIDYADGGGGRRWFTIASAPHEKRLQITTKLPPRPSKFKQELNKLKSGDKVILSPALGSFNLPRDKSEKLIFFAGGVGITPFRSMLVHHKYANESYDIKIIYLVKNKQKLFPNVLKDFDVSYEKSDYDIKQLDTEDKTIYLSGPEPLIKNYFEQLQNMGVQRSKIKLDYFPGYTEL